MRQPFVRRLALVVASSWLGSYSAAAACVELAGIQSDGGEGILDLDDLKVSLEFEPFDLSNPINPTIAGCSVGLETPIAMRTLLAIDTAVFSVSSMFHPKETALDIFGDKETSDSRRRCKTAEGDDEGTLLFDIHLRVAALYSVVYTAIQAMPYCRRQLEALMEDRGHSISLVLEDATSADTPWGLAKAYVDEINEYLTENDGWNADGSMNRDFNRVPFSDFAKTDSAGSSWTPYKPRNSPYEVDNELRWQPLQESNGLGYISTQEHVTPHIGMTARLFGFSSSQDEGDFASRKLDPPSYRCSYDQVAREVIAESALTATDEFKQAAISFFDNKFGSLVPLKIAYFLQPTSTLTIFDFYRLTVEVQLAIYNGVVLSWREKVRHDAPRPSTVIKQTIGDDMVEAYAGPDQGVQTMKASEWESFIRTMPHSEFPSASSCICQVFAEQVAYHVRADEIDPPVEFGPFSFSSWSEISQVCGDSRVWGGMHFAGAVPAGVDLCGGGEMAVSIYESIGGLVDGDEGAAVFNRDIGELMVRPL